MMSRVMSNDFPDSTPSPLCAGDPISRRTFGQTIGLVAAAGSLPPLGDGSPSGQSAGSGPPRADEALCNLTAVELAEGIRRKQVSAREVMTAHLARIERINSKVNAIVTLMAERALADAAKADEQTARGGALGVLH